MDYDEQVKGLVEELLQKVMNRELNLEDVQKQLLELSRKVDEQQELERSVESKFLADLQEMINPLVYSDDPEFRSLGKRIMRLLYEHRVKYAQIRYLEEKIG